MSYKVLNKNSASVTRLNDCPTSFIIQNATYTNLKYAILSKLSGIQLVDLSSGVAKVRYNGVYRITIDQLWIELNFLKTGSSQIKIGEKIITSIFNSAMSNPIFSATGIVELSKGQELPVTIYQSTGESATIKSVQIDVELIYQK